jgi:hypothetical protein
MTQPLVHRAAQSPGEPPRPEPEPMGQTKTNPFCTSVAEGAGGMRTAIVFPFNGVTESSANFSRPSREKLPGFFTTATVPHATAPFGITVTPSTETSDQTLNLTRSLRLAVLVVTQATASKETGVPGGRTRFSEIAVVSSTHNAFHLPYTLPRSVYSKPFYLCPLQTPGGGGHIFPVRSLDPGRLCGTQSASFASRRGPRSPRCRDPFSLLFHSFTLSRFVAPLFSYSYALFFRYRPASPSESINSALFAEAPGGGTSVKPIALLRCAPQVLEPPAHCQGTNLVKESTGVGCTCSPQK